MYLKELQKLYRQENKELNSDVIHNTNIDLKAQLQENAKSKRKTTLTFYVHIPVC